MTANSVASVSLNPPLVSVCVDREADMHSTLLDAPVFVINILSVEQEALSRRFAIPDGDKFDGVGFHRIEGWLVVLDGILAHIECVRHAEVPAGDHTIFIGRVTGGSAAEGHPLLYYRGGYGGRVQG